MKKHLDVLWYTRCPVPTGLGIAVQKGWLDESFRQRRTEIRSLRESREQAVRESHFDHTLKNSVRHGGNIPALWARASGRDTRLLGLSWVDETQRILTTPDSGIRTVKDLRGRRFGLPKRTRVQIDFTRAQALRGLENALRLEGLDIPDVEIVDFQIDAGFSGTATSKAAGGHYVFGSSHSGGQNAELVGLLRGEVDAIFLKGAIAAEFAHHFDLHTVIDTGTHPDPRIRSNNGTPRTLTVDRHLLDHHFDSATLLVEQVLRAEAWARTHAEETRRFLALETNSSEHWVSIAYGESVHQQIATDLTETAIHALQDFSDFLHRWQFIPAPVDVDAWIDARPLEAANRTRDTLAAGIVLKEREEALCALN
ncbi:MAG: ABC transporter substrate-binding protein [Zoogloeaceae bacterium]|jgi:ABC-type nitrate/sulfonate/bicarbonate transport system substrate-binding protein|nr:ABC transporter substrate-binding protein [Zoogloeaceae bacterium]